MRPYSSLIGDGLAGVMMAHIRYTELDPQIASLSAFWMRQILRDELGFQGAIFSDDLTMEGASVGGDVPARAQAALAAGADMALICNNRSAVGPVLDALDGFEQPVSYGRLAAMRADRSRYELARRGAHEWQNSLAELQAALERPQLVLDGKA